MSRMTAFLLALLGLVGVAGIHRFYTGKVATGILWLVTGGALRSRHGHRYNPNRCRWFPNERRPAAAIELKNGG